MDSNFNEMVPDISARAIFESVELTRRVRCLTSQQRIAEINRAFDLVLKQQARKRDASRAVYESARAAEILEGLRGQEHTRVLTRGHTSKGKTK